MSEDRLAAELFAARQRALDHSTQRHLSSMPSRIRRQYARFADELRPMLDNQDAQVAGAPHRSAESDVSFVIEALAAWEDGSVAPHDVLVAIRDQLAGKTPGGDGDD